MIRRTALTTLAASFAASLAIITPPQALRAQRSTFAQIDRFVALEMARQHIPGIAVGIYKNGRIALVKGYGLANVELDAPVKSATIFQSGSVGKQFTSAAIMMLMEEGKIGLDDSLPKYFPGAPSTWRGVTIRELLSHTSGLAEYASDSLTKPGGPLDIRLDFTEEEFVKFIETLPIEFAPGEGWEYRNTNYLLLGAVIRKVTGSFYGDVLQQRIFKPLGMTSTRIISETDIIPNRAAGYQLVDGKLKNQDWVSAAFNTTADGALYFNVLDLAKWDAALYGNGLLRQESRDAMWTVAKLKNGQPNAHRYAFAWFVDSINGHRVIEHSGSWQGFESYIARYVDDKITVVVLMNLGGADPAVVAHGIAGIYRPALAPPADSTRR
ncbi:MAG: beta-lactamase family protein [Gemmatimonadota bacterium]|nr:beta-lactamase family protein [Gemmatimonadota bacterium]